MNGTSVSTVNRAPQRALRPPSASGRFILVGGVPGAGKSTLLAWAAGQVGQVRMLDPDRYRHRLARLLPGVPYRCYRALVHALHTVATVGSILLGPAAAGTAGALVVHSTATRPRRREWLARLARLRGWEPVLFMVDVAEQTARAGQYERGRVVPAESFSRHWARWTQQRDRLVEAHDGSLPVGSWARVDVAGRDAARARLLQLIG